MKPFLLFVVLLLLVPMAVLNPLGRPAFLGYYAGIIAAWGAYMAAVQSRDRVAIASRNPSGAS